jgi:hypothetical protein
MYPKVYEIHIKLYFGDDYLHFSFPHELTGGDANDFLEKTSEVGAETQSPATERSH